MTWLLVMSGSRHDAPSRLHPLTRHFARIGGLTSADAGSSVGAVVATGCWHLPGEASRCGNSVSTVWPADAWFGARYAFGGRRDGVGKVVEDARVVVLDDVVDVPQSRSADL
jgi:hypothetical protein